MDRRARGRIVEYAGGQRIHETAAHPYSKALMSAVPIPDPDIEAARERIILKGELPTPRRCRRAAGSGPAARSRSRRAPRRSRPSATSVPALGRMHPRLTWPKAGGANPDRLRQRDRGCFESSCGRRVQAHGLGVHRHFDREHR
jgi:hypothetical protein